MSQPKPTHVNGAPAVVDLVKSDLDERDRVGTETYGVRLQPGNGRDALQDAYEEALDQALYLKQAIEERRRNGSWREAFMMLRDAVNTAFESYSGGDRPMAPPVWLTRLTIEADRIHERVSGQSSSGGEE